MDNNIENLFNELNKSIQNENALYQFYSSRLTAQILQILNNYMIQYDINEIKKIIDRLINNCKLIQKGYINGIKEINNNLDIFFKHIIDDGTNNLECDDKAREYKKQTSELSETISYQKTFDDIKTDIINMLGSNNQQLGYSLDTIFNDNMSKLETEIIKLHHQNKQIFEKIGEYIKKLGSLNNKKNINTNNQNDLIANYLIELNDGTKTDNQTKINNIFNEFASKIGDLLSSNMKNIDKKIVINEILNIFQKQFDIDYSIFHNKVNEEFIPMLIKRTSEALPKDPKFEISRDSITYNNSQKFSSNNKIINLDVAFVNIEEILTTKYELNASNPKYIKIIGLINTKKAEMENYLTKIVDNILIASIIEMQSQINKLVHNNIVTIKIKEDK